MKICLDDGQPGAIALTGALGIILRLQNLVELDREGRDTIVNPKFDQPPYHEHEPTL